MCLLTDCETRKRILPVLGHVDPFQSRKTSQERCMLMLLQNNCTSLFLICSIQTEMVTFDVWMRVSIDTTAPLGLFCFSRKQNVSEHVLIHTGLACKNRRKIETKNRVQTRKGLGIADIKVWLFCQSSDTTCSARSLNFLHPIGALQNLISERYQLELLVKHIGFLMRALVLRKY